MKDLKSLFKVHFLLLLIASAASTHAGTTLATDSFQVFAGDINNDGYEDYYFLAKNKILIVASDPAFPLPYTDAENFIISGADGSVKAWPGSVDIQRLEVVSLEAHNGDFNGDGQTDLLLHSSNVSRPSIILRGGKTARLPSNAKLMDTLEGATLAYSSVSVKDVDKDGKDEIEVTTNQSEILYAFSDANGNFSESDSGNRYGYTAVGATAGSFDVNSDGSANYSVPIAVPPGGAGMQPQLSFHYSSSGGDGIMGIGWDVSQPSVVSRCGKTLEEDGIVQGVLYTKLDAFCLDGQKLVSVSGAYGASGTEYRTQSESFSKIVSYGGTDATGPSYFKAWYKSGEIALFGNSADSRVEAGQSTIVERWHLQKIEDRYGNARSYLYDENNSTGEHYLRQITYPGGRVQLVYNDRASGAIEAFNRGHRSLTTRQLVQVTSYAGQSVFRRYHLEYDHMPMRLLNITECGADASCLDPTNFEWSERSSSFAHEEYGFFTTAGASKGKVLDVDGDGVQDLMVPMNGRWHVRYGTYMTSAVDTGAPDSYADNSLPFDINGDGRQELLIPNNRVWNILYATGTGYSYKSLNIDNVGWNYAPKVLDMNGDGLLDLLLAYNNTWHVRLNQGGTLGPAINTQINNDYYANSMPFDLEGDGRYELLIPRDNNWNVLRLNPNGTFSFQKIASGNLGYQYNPQLADVNSDGLDDLLVAHDNRWFLRINTGIGFKNEVLISNSNDGWKDTKVVDYDDDGRMDLMSPRGGKWYVLKANGEKLWSTLDTGINSTGAADSKLFDLDGNGLPDLLMPLSSDYWRIVYHGNDKLPNYMTRITNGLGLETAFDYLPITDQRVYKGGASVQYPLRNVYGAISVVAKVKTRITYGGTLFGNPVGLNKSLSYKYENLLYHVRGLGSLGFSKITRSESAETEVQKRVEQDYSHNWQQRQQGALLKETVFQKGRKIKEVSNTYRTLYREGSNNKIYYSYIPSSKEQVWDGALVSETLTSYRPDVWRNAATYSPSASGNMMWMKVAVKDAVGRTYYTETANAYDQENFSSWILGRLTKSTVTKGGTARSVQSKTSSWEYYPSTGYLRREVVEPDYPSLSLTKLYTYVPSTGLVDTVTTSSASGTSRVSDTDYDSLGRYPVRETNSLGQSVSYAYDPVLGLKTRVIAPNGQVSRTEYDGFGRVTASYQPNGTYTKSSLHWPGSNPPVAECESCFLPIYPAYFVRAIDQNGLWSKTYLDTRGEVIETHTLNAIGQVVVQSKRFNSRGQVSGVSEPYLAGTEPQYWTSTVEWDYQNRPTKVSNTQGLITQTVYKPLEQTVINEKGQSKTVRFYADGQQSAVIDNVGNIVEYEYDGSGAMVGMTDLSAGIKTSIGYDRRGQKIAMSDPNKGDWSYTYNAFGELLTQTDANGTTICMAYDSLGRMVKRIDGYKGSVATQAGENCAGDDQNPQTTKWFFDTAANGIGMLHYVEGPSGYRETYSYDTLSRPTQIVKLIGGETFITKTFYDAQGRPSKSVFPSGLATYNHYNALGFLTEVRKADNRDFYWKATDVDVRGNVTSAQLANGVMLVDKTFTPDRGFLESVATTRAGGSPGDLQLNFAGYDELGNVITRSDARLNNTEDFTFDELNRLETRTVLAGTEAPYTQSMSYAANGNIVTKWDNPAVYQYGDTCNGVKAGPHAVTAANGNSYCYDRNGNMVSGAGRTIAWTAFGKPAAFTRGATSVRFNYGPDRNRIERIHQVDGKTARTTYVGSYEKVVKNSGTNAQSVEERHYIAGIAVVTVKEGNLSIPAESYTLKDTLGSVVGYVDIGQLLAGKADAVERTSFDPWGKRRKDQNLADVSMTEMLSYQSAISDRGFTGHEHIDAIGLIHMNGRVYDPLIGRFISADPIIQDPSDLQSLNRYTYVRNNPVTLTDPSGFSWVSKTWKKLRRAVEKTAGFNFTAVIWKKSAREFGRFARKNKYVAEFAQIGGCMTGPLGCIAASTTITYGVSGDFQAGMKAGAIAFVQIAITGGIGDAKWGHFKTALAHGTTGGVASLARGGKFGSGFASGFFTSAVGDSLFTEGTSVADTARNTFVAAVISGTASQLSGGQFANGAVTGAFVYLYNHREHAKGRAVTESEEGIYLAAQDSRSGFQLSQEGAVQVFNKLGLANVPRQLAVDEAGIILADDMLTAAVPAQELVSTLEPSPFGKLRILITGTKIITNGLKIEAQKYWRNEIDDLRIGMGVRGGIKYNPDLMNRYRELPR